MLFRYFRYDPIHCGFIPDRKTPKAAQRTAMRFLSMAVGTGVMLFGFYILFLPEYDEVVLKRNNAAAKETWAALKNEIRELDDRITMLEREDDEHYRVLLNMEKLPATIRRGGSGGRTESEWINQSEFPMIKKGYQDVKVLWNRVRMGNQSYSELKEKLEEKEGMMASRPALQPLDNRQITRFHGLFGMRMHPVFRDWRFHHGLDLTARHGTPVYATGEGLVTLAKYSGGYGQVVFVNHGYGFETRYAHLSKIKVSEGQKVKRGELLGLVGSTGTSTGPHLHYEVLFKDEWVNPIHFMYRDLSQSDFNEIIREAKK